MSYRIVIAAARVAVTASIIVSVVALAPWPVQASGHAPARLTSKPVPGIQSAVSCLTIRLCVLGGQSSKGKGDIVAVHGGVPDRPQFVSHSQVMYSISCPNAAGCVAIARPTDDVGALFVKISAAGKVSGTKLITVPPGVTIDRISCTKLASCEVTGTDFLASPEAIEVGGWNGSKLSLHKVAPPKGTLDPSVQGISCAGTFCDVVGYADKGFNNVGFVVPVSRGKPGKLHTAPGDSLSGVACPSQSRCYAAGFTRTGGVVLTLNGASPAAPRPVKADLSAIACSGAACTGAGEQLGGTGFVGVLVAVNGGHVTSSTVVSPSGGYADVARMRDVFMAIGPAQHAGSELTRG